MRFFIHDGWISAGKGVLGVGAPAAGATLSDILKTGIPWLIGVVVGLLSAYSLFLDIRRKRREQRIADELARKASNS